MKEDCKKIPIRGNTPLIIAGKNDCKTKGEGRKYVLVQTRGCLEDIP